MAAEFDWFNHMEEVMKNRGETTTQKELKDVYSSWSTTYEKSIVGDHEYKGPTVAAELLTQKLKEFGFSNDARIMDLGCGTGLVGEQLQKRGYKNIDGIDLTPALLEIAKAKGIYGSLRQGTMGSPQCKELGVEANQYDAAICVGVLTLAHVKNEGLDDIVHVVKPGGLACFGIREFAFTDPQGGYQQKIEQLCKEGKWKLLVKHHESAYLKDGGAILFVYQIL